MPDTPNIAAALSDRYVIERELGSGGMAIVYLAHDRKLDREVALKVLRPELGAVLGAERFLTEIKISARLDHPHILTLIDSGDADGMLYYVLPYVRGETLREKLKREHQLGLEEALTITKQVASALDYAHRQGARPPRHQAREHPACRKARRCSPTSASRSRSRRPAATASRRPVSRSARRST